MESQHQSQHQTWVNFSYLALAVLVGYLFFAFAGQVVVSFDLESKVRSLDAILKGLAFLVSLACYFGLTRNDSANQFMNEVVAELARVTWPTALETRDSTVIVMIMVLISGVILGFLDYCWIQMLKRIL